MLSWYSPDPPPLPETPLPLTVKPPPKPKPPKGSPPPPPPPRCICSRISARFRPPAPPKPNPPKGSPSNCAQSDGCDGAPTEQPPARLVARTLLGCYPNPRSRPHTVFAPAHCNQDGSSVMRVTSLAGWRNPSVVGKHRTLEAIPRVAVSSWIARALTPTLMGATHPGVAAGGLHALGGII